MEGNGYRRWLAAYILSLLPWCDYGCVFGFVIGSVGLVVANGIVRSGTFRLYVVGRRYRYGRFLLFYSADGLI